MRHLNQYNDLNIRNFDFLKDLKIWIFRKILKNPKIFWIFRKILEKNWNFFVIFWAQIFNISVLKEKKIFWNFRSQYPGHNFWPWYWKFVMIRTYLESNYIKLRSLDDFKWLKKKSHGRHTDEKIYFLGSSKFFFSVVCISLNYVC